MPELPEVQTIVDDLNKKIIGRKIVGVWFDASKIIKKPKPSDLEKQIKGLKIVEIKRRGKNILIYLEKCQASGIKCRMFLLLVHQKLTGHLLYGKWRVEKVNRSSFTVRSLIRGLLEEKVNNYIHLIFYLDNDWQLALSDLRKFAKVMFGKKEEIENLPDLKKLGFEPMDKNFNFEKFKNLISKKSGKTKQILMNQKIIAGIGNIYSDEILWKAKIHPFKPANKLTSAELKRIFSAMKEILKKAVNLRGTSISDYRDTGGKSGKYGEIRKTYQREGKPCFRCKVSIKRVKMGGRSAYYCSKCQIGRQ